MGIMSETYVWPISSNHLYCVFSVFICLHKINNFPILGDSYSLLSSWFAVMHKCVSLFLWIFLGTFSAERSSAWMSMYKCFKHRNVIVLECWKLNQGWSGMMMGKLNQWKSCIIHYLLLSTERSSHMNVEGNHPKYFKCRNVLRLECWKLKQS